MAQAILLKDVENLGDAARPSTSRPATCATTWSPASSPSPRPRARSRSRSAAARRPRRPSARPTERAGETAALLSKTVLTIHHRAGEDGKLFGSVTSKEIADAIREARGLRIDRKRIRLEQPIREIGTYMVEVELAGGDTATVKTIVAEAEVARSGATDIVRRR